jgi:integrase/recombinase XerD
MRFIMLQGVYVCPKAIARARRSWLLPYVEMYFEDLTAKRFKKRSLRLYTNYLLSFGEFLERQGVQDISRLPEWIEPFVRQYHPEKPALIIWRSTLTCFVRFLRQQGLIPMAPPLVPKCPHADLVVEYTQFLREHRGVTHKHIQRTQRCCEDFLTFLESQSVAELGSMPPELIHRFIVRDGHHYERVTMGTRCGALRRFLAHLHRRGIMPVDYSPVVIAPTIYQQEQCPRFLTRVQVEAVLAAVDLQNPCGRRDYAMISLLAAYGLRGIEVVRLRLDDIDWRHQKLHIRRRKAGNQTTYPLSASVGEAIVKYLRHDRPASGHREVFLTTKPPFPPFAGSANLCVHVQGYIAKAGIRVEHPGMHAFRYSCAQRLLDAGTPIKTIGDYLGHGVPETTGRYVKIAIEQLRDVADGDGEDLV